MLRARVPDVRRRRGHAESAPPWTRTKNPLIKSHSATPEILEENAGSRNHGGTSGGSCGEHRQPAADLQAVVEAWPRLPEALRAGILAMVKAAGP